MQTAALGGVYQIRNVQTGKVYVGSAESFRIRWGQHRRLLRRGAHHSSALQADFLALGEDAFVFEPLIICAKPHLLFFEQRVIDRFDAVATGYNMASFAGAPMRRNYGSKRPGPRGRLKDYTLPAGTPTGLYQSPDVLQLPSPLFRRG